MNRMGGKWTKITWIASVLLVLASGVSAQTTQPVASAQGRFENEPILPDHSRNGASASTTQPVASISTTPQLDMGRVALALSLVLGLIFAMRWAGRRFFPNASVPRSSGAMKVLSRLVISPKQQLLMVQVGRRIVVVGDAGGQMSALSEITDAEEAASLIGQIAEEKSQISMKAFSSLFHRAGETFEEKLETPDPPPPEAGSPRDPVVENARGEIDELADKVRLLSAQFNGK